MQKKLRFDRREYAQRLEAIETIHAVESLSDGRLKCAKRLCAFVFNYERSSAEGDITLVTSNPTDQATCAILQRCQISVRTLANWICWAKNAGLISVSIDCDGMRRQRTSISINWVRIRELSEFKKEPGIMQRLRRHHATVA